jgi:aspartate aminotransferase
VEAIQRHVVPKGKNWFAYETSEYEPCAFLAERLSEELGAAFEPEDIAMTTGAFGAISLAFRVVLGAGDNVTIPVPGWFCYEPMVDGGASATF